jgi:hypothetical protein
MDKHRDSDLLDLFGTTTEIAAMFEIKPQAVSQWRKYGVPKARRQTMQALRPDLFGEHPAALQAKRAAPECEPAHAN